MVGSGPRPRAAEEPPGAGARGGSSGTRRWGGEWVSGGLEDGEGDSGRVGAARQAAHAKETGPMRGDRESRDGEVAGRANMRIIETVVRARVSDPPAQDRILSAARERLASWLEKGARLQPVEVARSNAQQEALRSRERQRSR